jgi:hypothetical protein
MLWQSAPMMATTMCRPAPAAQTTLQPTVQPTVVLVPQQAMSVNPPESSSGDAAAAAFATTVSKTAKNGVWEGMAAWKAEQTALNREWKGKEARRNAISKKPADKSSDSVGPRAVFVDLSKIVPTGILN